MASSYTGLGTELMTTGENAGNWGTKTNVNLQIIEQLAGGYEEQDIAGGADTTTLAVSDGSAGAVLAHRIIKFTGTITGNQVVTIPLDVQQMYVLVNGTSGSYTVQFKYATGSGSSVTFSATDKGTKIVYATADDGTNPNIVDTGIASHQINNTITVGVDDTGYDVKFFGATASAYMLWDESADDLVLAGAAGIDLAGDIDVDGTTNLDVVDIDGAVQIDGTVTVGVDGTGLDVKFFSASAGAYMHWDESADLLDIRGATAAGAGLLRLTTGELTVVDGNKLGRIDFQAPLESDGTDAILVAASIWAEADDTFAAGVNNTDLVFALGKSEAAAEKFRFTADNEIGIAGANYGTDGQVLTSGGAGAAVAWEDAGGGAVTALNNATQSELVTVGSTTTELDAEANLTFTGSALTCIGTVTVGVDGTGHDVKYFGDTSGAYMLWDESADDLVLAGDAGIDLAGDIDVDGTANLDTVDIDGNTQVDGTITVGVDNTGYDVKLFGATASSYMLWDESADSLLLEASTLDLNGTADGLILDADGDTTISSPSDDQIDFEIAGADDFTMTANTFTILSGSTIAIAAGGAITNAGSMAPDITSTGKSLVFGF